MSRSVNKQIKLKVRRLGSLLKAHQGIDQLGIQSNAIVVDVAENLLKIQDVIDSFILKEEEIKRDVIERAGVKIATPDQQVKMSPEAEIRNKIVTMSNEDVELSLNEISAPALFAGETKPVPGMIAALMPVLKDLENVPLDESLQ